MKIKVETKNAMYPMPIILVGANVNGKPNFITVAHVGILSFDTVSLGLGKMHLTNKGIFENNCFSINIPSEDMVVITDYSGLVSGSKVDKSVLFDIEYGTLNTAPLIKNAPVNMELELIECLDYKTHDIFIGKVVNTYAEQSVLLNGKIDLTKVKPMLFDMHQMKYWKLGESFADCWNIGKSFGKY